MPIYEFYCPDCNTLFNFFSRTINTFKRPQCPKCKTRVLQRQMSAFAITGKSRDTDDAEDLPFDASKMDKAVQMLAGEADRINEDDPRQAANLMRKLSDMTGMEMGTGMQEALRRMERGEDPESIEADMGDLLEGEDPFVLAGRKGKGGTTAILPPMHDETLYDL